MGDRFRSDGSEKRGGFLGAIPNPLGGTSTELSVGVPVMGREMEIPTMVPGLSAENLRALLMSQGPQEIPQEVIDMAQRHAAIRLATGQSPYAGDNESPSPTRGPGPWKDEYVLPGNDSRVVNMLLSSFAR